jgi:hypothetical protein
LGGERLASPKGKGSGAPRGFPQAVPATASPRPQRVAVGDTRPVAPSRTARRRRARESGPGGCQAAPFAKGQPTGQAKKPGRKPGKDYGPKAHRQPPSREQIDEVHEASLPHACPDCGGPLDETHVAQQFQVQIPRKPIHRQFNVHVGQCRQCRRRVQGRHPLQTSDALGAAAAQLGPDARDRPPRRLRP